MINFKSFFSGLNNCVEIMSISQIGAANNCHFVWQLKSLDERLIESIENINEVIFASKAKVWPIEAICEVKFVKACVYHSFFSVMS
jgi:hypothetical protein